MACFIVPAAEAIAVTAATKLLGHKKAEKNSSVRTLFVTEKLGWLNKMLWGGSALLAFEHLWHGEVVPFFPFLSAMESAEETASMLHEMGCKNGDEQGHDQASLPADFASRSAFFSRTRLTATIPIQTPVTMSAIPAPTVPIS